jgi:hypothetical protein
VSRRRGEAGQALLLALLVLFLASLAASLVAMDLGIRQRGMRDEAVRAHLRGLLDGALAEALALLAARQPVGESADWIGAPGVRARSGARLGPRRGARVEVWVWASWAGRWAGAQAEVHQPPDEPPRVLAWRRLPAATAATLAE